MKGTEKTDRAGTESACKEGPDRGGVLCKLADLARQFKGATLALVAAVSLDCSGTGSRVEEEGYTPQCPGGSRMVTADWARGPGCLDSRFISVDELTKHCKETGQGVRYVMGTQGKKFSKFECASK